MHPEPNRTSRPSVWWIRVCYTMPLLIMLPFMNEAGWYGTGRSGALQRLMQLAAFVAGIFSSYVVLIRGSGSQRMVVAPAVLGYSALVIGILLDDLV